LVVVAFWFWCWTSADGEALGIHRSINTRGGDYHSSTWHSIYIILCFILSVPILLSAIFVRWRLRRKQHPSIQFTQFNSVHAIQFSPHTAFSGTQQYIDESPFAMKDMQYNHKRLGLSEQHMAFYLHYLMFTLSLPILLSAIFVRWRLRRKQHSVHAIQFNSVHAIQFSSQAGTQQYIRSFLLHSKTCNIITRGWDWDYQSGTWHSFTLSYVLHFLYPFFFRLTSCGDGFDASSIQFTQFNSIQFTLFNSVHTQHSHAHSSTSRSFLLHSKTNTTHTVQFTHNILRFTAVHRGVSLCIQRRTRHRRKQHSVHVKFNSVHAIQFSSHKAISGTQQYIEEFPFEFKDEHDIAQLYIVGVSYVLEGQHYTSSFHSSFCFCDKFLQLH
jgi:hypothetical protein